MGKAARINAEHEAQRPKVLNTISVNILDNGNVQVSGPISDPVLVLDVLGKALMAVAQFQHQNKGRIVQASPKLVVPK